MESSPSALRTDDPLPPQAADLLTRVELEIARRADEFARMFPSTNLHNLSCWLLAEAELLGREPLAAATS